MSTEHVVDFKDEVDWLRPSGRTGAALLVSDDINRRLLESVLSHLEVRATVLDPGDLTPQTLGTFEVVLADESEARRLRPLLSPVEGKADSVNAALIAVCSKADVLPSSVPHDFDGVLHLPQEPGPLLAQLSVILYAHRAFVRRFESAFEELQLNRKIFRSVSSGISVARATAPDLPLIYVNPAFEVMTGYSFEEVVGRNCRFLQGTELNQPGVALLREAIAQRREVVAILKNYRKDGSFFWNELALSPIRNRDGEVTHFVGIQNDITARVEFEAALRESEKLAAVGRLAASIAHEINNPLEAVTNLLYLARHGNGTEDISHYLDLADKELQRVSLITSQSLRFYKQSTKPRAIRPADLMDSVLDLYHSKLQNASVRIERRQRRSQAIVCLESEIRQVVSNLVRNAIEAMAAQGGGRLLIRFRDATDWRTGTQGALLTVADTGSGISPESMKHLYTAFFTTKGTSGTGLGLWVSAEIIQRHQGRLRVRSRQGSPPSGTVFQLFLPFQAFAA